MEACIDTFSSVFNNTPEYSRNVNGFENICQSHHPHFSLANNSSNTGNNSIADAGHYHHPHSQRQAGVTMFTNNDYLPQQSSFQSLNWNDRQLLSGSSSNKMEITPNPTATTPSTSTTAAANQDFVPFTSAASAAFNLQQLHHGICSVGTMPSWQPAFDFTECASTNVPSQNDEGNDTRIPMPLSMSSVPTTSSSPNVLTPNSHGSSTNANTNPTSPNQPPRHFLNSNGNVQCAPNASTNGTCTTPTQMQNSYSNRGNVTNHSQEVAMSVASSNGIDTLTLSFSAALMNGSSPATPILTPTSPHSPMPYMPTSPVRPTEPASYSTPEYVKMATPTRHVRLRTNAKLDMDRQKAQEDDRRDKELQKQQRPPMQSTAAVPVSAQPAVNVVVPSRVLQVTSALENPTPFHVEQTRRFKIKQYCAGIANSLPDVQGTSSLGGTAPPVVQLRPPSKYNNRLQHLITDGAVSSAPPNYSTTPVSPIPVIEPAAASSPGPSQRSSVETSVNDEFEDSILDLLLTDEKTGDQFQKSDQVASLPQPGFNRVSGIPEASSSCPVDSNDVVTIGDPVKLTKDRIKKDNHNKIERKRRFHINDMITEQSRLLPRANERHHERIGEVKQNKGSILKASVDYTKVLKYDNDSLHLKLQKAEEEKKELLLRLQRVEQLCKQGGVQIPEEIITWKTGNTSDELTTLLNTEQVRIKQEPISYPAADDFDRNVCDMMEEDRSVVTGNNDPMFGQPVETEEGFHHPDGMDFND